MRVIIILTATIATCVSYLINSKWDKGPVVSSAFVVLLSGIILPYIFPENGNLLALVSATGSYGAMVSKRELSSINDMIAIGTACGILFIFFTDVFVGVGGKLGAIAAIAGFSWLGIKRTFELEVL